jgi:endoglucanase
MDTLKLLRSLSEAAGPSGYEGEVADVVREAWGPFADETALDRVGSLLAFKHGAGPEPRPRVLLAAHLDEIGLMVKQIVAHPDEVHGSGFLRVTNLGGVDIRQLLGQTVEIHGSRGGRQRLTGIIGALPESRQPENKSGKAFGYEELIVDPGLSFAALKERVAVGDVISFRQPLRELLNGRVTGKALDNRASIAAVTVCLEYLRGRQHAWDVVAVATAQEESALLGAFTSGFAQRPDVAIAIDVTFGKGPGASDDEAHELDEGPAIGVGPNVHPGVQKALQAAAKGLEMKVQVDPHAAYSGTDAMGLQIAREGIPTGVVSIPLRYMHTMVESVALSDVERTGRLLGEFVARLDDAFLGRLVAELIDETEADNE